MTLPCRTTTPSNVSRKPLFEERHFCSHCLAISRRSLSRRYARGLNVRWRPEQSNSSISLSESSHCPSHCCVGLLFHRSFISTTLLYYRGTGDMVGIIIRGRWLGSFDSAEAGFIVSRSWYQILVAFLGCALFRSSVSCRAQRPVWLLSFFCLTPLTLSFEPELRIAGWVAPAGEWDYRNSSRFCYSFTAFPTFYPFLMLQFLCGREVYLESDFCPRRPSNSGWDYLN